MYDNGWKSGDDQNNMANKSDDNGDTNRVVTSPARISEIASQDGGKVSPELIKCRQSGGSLLTSTQCTRLAISTAGTCV